MNGVRFLVAEDDPLVSRLLERELRAYGWVEVVSTAAEARERLGERSFHALVADVGLPDGSGLDLVAEALAADDGVAALVLSGAVDADRLAEAHKLGVPYLLKPVDAAQLAVFVARARQTRRPDTRRGRIDGAADAWSTRYALSDAEERILRLAAHGTPRSELARERGVLPSTIKKQVNALLGKTGDASLDVAVARLLREALAPGR